MNAQEKRIVAVELTIGNLSGDVHKLTQALHEILAVLKPEVVAEVATKRPVGRPKKILASPVPTPEKRELYVKAYKPTCDEPTCTRYGKLENAKGFTEAGGAYHTLRTGHKIS